jgi:hypothetical protein
VWWKLAPGGSAVVTEEEGIVRACLAIRRWLRRLKCDQSRIIWRE